MVRGWNFHEIENWSGTFCNFLVTGLLALHVEFTSKWRTMGLKLVRENHKTSTWRAGGLKLVRENRAIRVGHLTRWIRCLTLFDGISSIGRRRTVGPILATGSRDGNGGQDETSKEPNKVRSRRSYRMTRDKHLCFLLPGRSKSWGLLLGFA
jgi:hypothetical protein